MMKIMKSCLVVCFPTGAGYAWSIFPWAWITQLHAAVGNAALPKTVDYAAWPASCECPHTEFLHNMCNFHMHLENCWSMLTTVCSQMLATVPRHPANTVE